MEQWGVISIASQKHRWKQFPESVLHYSLFTINLKSMSYSYSIPNHSHSSRGLYFDDRLQTTDCSGLYTLMGYVNGTWYDIHTVSGAGTGTIEVDRSVNAIEVDTTLFIPGQTYQFKWMDGNGVSSNIITLTIPYVSSGSGSGSGFGTAVSVTILDAEIGRVDVQASGLAYGEQAIIRIYYSIDGVTYTMDSQGYVDNSALLFTSPDFAPGCSIYAALIGNGWTVYSQTITLANVGSSSSSGVLSPSITVINAEAGQVQVEVSGSDNRTLNLSLLVSGSTLSGMTVYSNGEYTFYSNNILPGCTVQVSMFDQVSATTVYSNTLTIPGADSSSGSGSNFRSGSGSGSGASVVPFTVTITSIVDGNLDATVSGDITAVPGYDPSAPIIAYLYYRPTGTGAFGLWTGGLDNTGFTSSYQGVIGFNPAGIVAGNDYQVVIMSDGAMIAFSQVVSVPDLGTSSSLGISPSPIRLLGLNNDGSGNTLAAFSANITRSNIQGCLLDVTASTSSAYFATFEGPVFFPSHSFGLAFTPGHQYQFALVDLDINPTGNISDPSTIFSNTLTAADIVIDSVASVGGAISITATIDPSLSGYAFSMYRNSDASGNTMLMVHSLPTSSAFLYGVYVSGGLVQICLSPDGETSDIVSASVFTTLT